MWVTLYKEDNHLVKKPTRETGKGEGRGYFGNEVTSRYTCAREKLRRKGDYSGGLRLKAEVSKLAIQGLVCIIQRKKCMVGS